MRSVFLACVIAERIMVVGNGWGEVVFGCFLKRRLVYIQFKDLFTTQPMPVELTVCQLKTKTTQQDRRGQHITQYIDSQDTTQEKETGQLQQLRK